MRLTCHRREEGLVCGNVCLNQRVVEKGGGCVTADIRMDPKPGGILPVLSVMENLLPGQKYGKYIRLFAGMVLILLVAEPFTSGFDLEEVLARSYENLVLRWEAGELQDDLGAEEQEYLGRVLSEYEEAVSQDIQELGQVLRPGFVRMQRSH